VKVLKMKKIKHMEVYDLAPKNNSEIIFSKMLLEFSTPIIKDIIDMGDFLKVKSDSGKEFFELRKTLYYWRNNPEKNDLLLKKDLKINPELTKMMQGRNMLGVADNTDWIESFNIGSIMHMTPISYDEFTFVGDINYEISRKLIMEKVKNNNIF
jgi:hypothetical protein